MSSLEMVGHPVIYAPTCAFMAPRSPSYAFHPADGQAVQRRTLKAKAGNGEEEAAFFELFFEKAKEGGILVVSEVRQTLEARLERPVAPALFNTSAKERYFSFRHGNRDAPPFSKGGPGGILARKRTESGHSFDGLQPEWAPLRGWVGCRDR